MKKIYLDICKLAALLILLVGLLDAAHKIPFKKLYQIDSASAATYYDLHGQAWSDTIGWISFNCLEGGPTGNNICATSNYKVSTDATGLLSGYAWSDNVGWIDFGQTSGCPSAPCRGSLTAGGLTGWARVISPFIPIDPHPSRGGWDGWINLNGGTYGVTRSGNDLGGTAWGDINLGWISFNCLTGGPTANNICATSNYKVYVTATTIPDPTLTLTVPAHGYTSSTTTYPINWATTNVDTCTASLDWSGSKAVPSGSQTIGPFPAEGTYNYALACHNNTYNLDVSATRQFSVTNGTCDGGETVPGNPYDCTSVVSKFEANPKIVKEGKSSTLNWTITGAQSCKLYDPNNVLLVNIPNGNQTGSYVVNNVTQKLTYRISCLGNVNSYATISVYLLYER